MRFDPKRFGARCDACPIFQTCKGKITPVGPRWTPEAPQAVILSDHPGDTETATGEPLTGMAGQLMGDVFATRFDLLEYDAPMPVLHKMHKSNALLCKPTRKMSDVEWRQAITACRPRLRREFDLLRQKGWTGRCIAMGGKILQALTGERKITDWIGPPRFGASFNEKGFKDDKKVDIDFRDIRLLPTVNPARCLRQPQWMGVYITHLLRGFEFCTHRLPDWEWRPTFIEPNQAQLDALNSFNVFEPLAMDCETDGPQHPMTLKSSKYKKKQFKQLNLLDVGFSNGQINVCVQWHRVTKMADEGDYIAHQIVVRTRWLLLNARKAIWQNCLYDLVALKAIKGWNIPFPHFDTLIGFKLVAPLLPGSLAFQASLFTHAERWKDEFKSGGSDDDPSLRYASADPDERATYCARDCEQTFIAYKKIQEQMQGAHNIDFLWNQQMKLLKIALDMQIRGINVDTSTFKAHGYRLTQTCSKFRGLQEDLVEKTGGTKGVVNKAGKPHEGVDWNPNSRFHVIRYFARVGHQPMTFSESGDPSYKAKVLEGLCKVTGIPEISEMARALLFWRKAHKILSTNILGLPYTTYSERVDGIGMQLVHRVHPGWLPFRTKSGRWGCKEPNAQNITKVIRNMFVGDYFDDVEIDIAA